MKKVLLLSSLMLLGLGFLFQPAYGQLDRMIKRTKDKTQQKVQKRVERKVDKAVDNTLDEAEGTVDGKSKKKDKKDKKKDKKNKKNKDDDSASEDDNDNSSGGDSNKTNSTGGTTTTNKNSGNTNTSTGGNNTSGGSNTGNSGVDMSNKGTSNSGNSSAGSNSGGSTSSNSGSLLNTKRANTTSSAKSDFYPGDYLLFTDDLYSEEQGEFPSKWNLMGGSAENSRFGNSNVIAFNGIDTEITPLLRSEEFLPETFTVEFDAYFYANGNGDAYFVKLRGLEPIKIVRNSAEMGRFNGFAKDEMSRASWRKVAMSYNQGSLKLYLDHNRVLNIPKIGPAPTSFSIAAVSPGARTGEPAMVRNIRVAMGGTDLYEYFLAEGKIVTRMISFDEGQSTLRAESSQSLEEIAKIMNDHPESKFSIQCHTDSKGNDALNKTLSEQRAQNVKNELEKRGVATSRLEVMGFGESKPVDTNKTIEGRLNNNRVEFVQL